MIRTYKEEFWTVTGEFYINNAQPNLTPEQQAQIIGGMVLTNQLTINFKGGECPLVPDGHVSVI